MSVENLYQKAVDLLTKLIETPSFSKEEDQTALILMNWLSQFNIPVKRNLNNVWAVNKYFDETKPSILLNSHHDTVKPNKGYTKNPFQPEISDGKLYGLGSNDAGGPMVTLMSLFVYFYEKQDLKYNLVLAITAEEENSGDDGLYSLKKIIPPIDFAVVGEPTEMKMAIAEKGLLVIDGHASGISGHAAHENTVSALYNAIDDINWIRSYEFPKISETLGKVKMSVTQIQAGDQHNVVPAKCDFVIDVRVNDLYKNQEVFDYLQSQTKSELVARSFRLNSSSIPESHIIVETWKKLGGETYGSPTCSDQAVLDCPSLKMGPGSSLRSHKADEFIYLYEIQEGIKIYVQLFEQFIY